MAYTKHIWQDGEAGGTPLVAKKLNEMESGIENATDVADDALAVANSASSMASDAAGDAADAERVSEEARGTAIEARNTANNAYNKAKAAESAAAVTSSECATVSAQALNAVLAAEAAEDTAAGAVARAKSAEAVAADANDASTAASELAREAVSTANTAMGMVRGSLPFQRLYLPQSRISKGFVQAGELIHDNTTQLIVRPNGKKATTVTVPELGIYGITWTVAGNTTWGGYMAIRSGDQTNLVALQRPHVKSWHWTLSVPAIRLGDERFPDVRFMLVSDMDGLASQEISIVRLA